MFHFILLCRILSLNFLVWEIWRFGNSMGYGHMVMRGSNVGLWTRKSTIWVIFSTRIGDIRNNFTFAVTRNVYILLIISCRWPEKSFRPELSPAILVVSTRIVTSNSGRYTNPTGLFLYYIIVGRIFMFKFKRKLKIVMKRFKKLT